MASDLTIKQLLHITNKSVHFSGSGNLMTALRSVLLARRSSLEYICILCQQRQHHKDKLWVMHSPLYISGLITSTIKYHPKGVGNATEQGKKKTFSSCIITANINIIQPECCSGIFFFILRYFFYVSGDEELISVQRSQISKRSSL